MSDFTPAEIVLEWSADPLSDTTPTYVRIQPDEIMGMEWWAGVEREGDEPQPGGLTVRLKNVNRKWEPLYSTNTIDTEQRFKLTLDGVVEGVWYSTDFEVEFPADTGYSEVVVTCSDGTEVLALDDLPELDPPDAQSYADVAAADEPFAHYPHGEGAGTTASPLFRRTTRRFTSLQGGQKRRRRLRIPRGTRYSLPPAEGLAGPPGVYKLNPLLGQPGLVVGDPGSSVFFDGDSYMRANLEDATAAFITGNALTIMAVYEPTVVDLSGGIVAGPTISAVGTIFYLSQELTGAGVYEFGVRQTGPTLVSVQATTAPQVGVTVHVGGTYDGNWLRLYVNGVEEASTSSPGQLATPTDVLAVFAGFTAASAPGYQQHTIFYEHALSPERMLAHATAALSRGYPEQTAGARIAAIATTDLWAETEIQTTGRNVIPQMQHGQARLEEIAELMHAEGPRTMFFFNGAGNPVYLGHEWQATNANYNTVQATFGEGGISCKGGEPEYDHETFNTVTASREGGPLVTMTDTTEEGVRRRRVNAEFTDLLLVEDGHVESVAYHVLQLYKEPAKRPKPITIVGSRALTQILDLDIGHLIRVKTPSDPGAPFDRVAWILKKHKTLDANRNITCTYHLSRGFDGATTTAMAGIAGYSAADTAKAA